MQTTDVFSASFVAHEQVYTYLTPVSASSSTITSITHDDNVPMYVGHRDAEGRTPRKGRANPDRDPTSEPDAELALQVKEKLKLRVGKPKAVTGHSPREDAGS